MRKAIHLPGLNGLRAIAAIGVVLSHITMGLPDFGLAPAAGWGNHDGTTGYMLGGYGVSIFFSLSGFLITYLLLHEQKKTDTINIKLFYTRRILRIWPLYYLYFIVALLLSVVIGFKINPLSVFFYTVLAANIPSILGTTLSFLPHYWSLGVEEQFYLFWPWLVRASHKHLLTIAITICILLTGTRIVINYLAIHHGFGLAYQVVDQLPFQRMMIGCIGGILYYKRNDLFIRISTHPLTQAICWGVLFLIAINKFHLASVIDSELVSLVTVCIIIAQVTKRNRIINLENTFCDFLGKISYGIYVIHPLIVYFMARLERAVGGPVLVKYLIVYSSVTGVTILAAFLSYRFYEQRFLKLKIKYSVVESSGNKED